MERRVSRPAALLPGQVVPGQAAAALPGEEVHWLKSYTIILDFWHPQQFTR